MQAQPVLMVTRNAALWQHWQQIDGARWMPARGQGMQDLQRWAAQSRELVLFDAALPGRPDWDAPAWRLAFKGLKVLVLSAHPNDSEAHQALASGASGYAHAFTPVSSLNTIVQSICEGSVWMGRSLLQRLLQDVDSRLPPPTAQDWALNLSPREQEVARLAATGIGNL